MNTLLLLCTMCTYVPDNHTLDQSLTTRGYIEYHIARLGLRKAKSKAKRNDLSIRTQGKLSTGEPLKVYLKIRKREARVGIKIKL